jgi:hypothetical protein
MPLVPAGPIPAPPPVGVPPVEVPDVPEEAPPVGVVVPPVPVAVPPEPAAFGVKGAGDSVPQAPENPPKSANPKSSARFPARFTSQNSNSNPCRHACDTAGFDIAISAQKNDSHRTKKNDFVQAAWQSTTSLH